jgi:DNA invertase Pin-like site-specific DNA recombinase
MAAARQRQLDVVLVYRFDRFARSVRHLVTALDEFQALGVDFVSYTESVDTSTPLGRALFSIVAALGELERALIVERSVEG